MNYHNFIRIARMFLILIVQITILNNIHILGYITPLLLGYVVLACHKGSNRIGLLLLGFFTGLIFDTFSNTAGMGSASCTLLAMMQPGFLKILTPRDAAENFAPGFSTMGTWRYILYCFLGTFVMLSVFYLLDAFTIANWQLTLIAIGGGTLISTFLCIVVELIAKVKDNS